MARPLFIGVRFAYRHLCGLIHMIGIILAILIVFSPLIALCTLPWLVAWLARRCGRRGWPYGLTVFLAESVFLFWDWLPMEISYKNKCESEAGLTVYKTPEEWQAENPGVWETLTPMRSTAITIQGNATRHQLNNRFAWNTDRIKHEFSVFEIRDSIIDMQTNALMSVYVGFVTSYSHSTLNNKFKYFRFWMEKRGCDYYNAFGWKMPREFREHLRLERSRFLNLARSFSGDDKK